MPESPQEEVTRILEEIQQGDESAVRRLFPLVYEELRRMAAAYLGRERPGHTLQPTALVHDAFLKLVGREEGQFAGRGQFFAVAARAMRRILIDHARSRKAAKRGGGAARLSLDGALDAPAPDRDLWLVALDEALERLAVVDPRQARVVELRFFGGLTIDETARVLEVSAATVERDWAMARAWLHREMTRGGA